MTIAYNTPCTVDAVLLWCGVPLVMIGGLNWFFWMVQGRNGSLQRTILNRYWNQLWHDVMNPIFLVTFPCFTYVPVSVPVCFAVCLIPVSSSFLFCFIPVTCFMSCSPGPFYITCHSHILSPSPISSGLASTYMEAPQVLTCYQYNLLR